MPSTAKPTRRKTERPAEIVQAAAEVFAEVGFARAKIADIAKRAGAAKGTVYLYFATKEKLFEAVVRALIKPQFVHIEQMAASFPGPAGQLLTGILLHVYAELINAPQRRAIMRILIAEGPRFPHLTAFYYQEVIAAAQQLLRSVIQRGVDAGEFRPAAALDYPGVIVGPAIMAAIWKMIFDAADPLDVEQFAQAHIDLVLYGLQTSPSDVTQRTATPQPGGSAGS